MVWDAEEQPGGAEEMSATSHAEWTALALSRTRKLNNFCNVHGAPTLLRTSTSLDGIDGTRVSSRQGRLRLSQKPVAVRVA